MVIAGGYWLGACHSEAVRSKIFGLGTNIKVETLHPEMKSSLGKMIKIVEGLVRYENEKSTLRITSNYAMK